MGAPKLAVEFPFGGGEVLHEDVAGTDHDGDGRPARIANDRMAEQARAIALQMGQDEGHGRAGAMVVVQGAGTA